MNIFTCVDLEPGGALTLSATHHRHPKVAITKVANRHLVCADGYCNLDAGAGVYVTPEGELIVYGAAFWVDGDRLKLTEFAAPEF